MQATGFVTVGDASIGYDVSGTGHPVLLLHAGIADRRMWDDQIEPFSEHFTVIRYDARGFGETRRPPTVFRSYQDAIALLDHLGLEQAHVIGASMGAQTALDLAVSAPDRVSAVVPVSARTGVPASDALRAGWQAVDDLFEAGDIDGANELELRMWVDGPNRGPDAVAASVRERVREMNGALLIRDDTEDNEQELEQSTEDGLGRISAPTFVVWGDQDVAGVLEAGPKLTAAIPGARSVVIPGTAHLPSMEKSDDFNRLVIEFLRSVSRA